MGLVAGRHLQGAAFDLDEIARCEPVSGSPATMRLRAKQQGPPVGMDMRGATRARLIGS